MTKIMTITSGLPGVGKTHLAINLVLEQVRRGYQSAVFYARDCATPIDDLITIQPPVALLRREEDEQARGLLRSGYQGADILSCGTPLAEWPSIQPELRAGCLRDMDVRGGYDHFLIDTSGMEPRSQLACCRATDSVVLVVTAESQSQAEAFALLRVLQLNGFAGKLLLIINKVRYPSDSKDIHAAFSQQVKQHLGLDIPLLGYVVDDEAVAKAQRAREAYTTLYPDAPATASIISMGGILNDDSSGFFQGPRTLQQLWQVLIDDIQQPVVLPGGVRLEPEFEDLPVRQQQSTAQVAS